MRKKNFWLLAVGFCLLGLGGFTQETKKEVLAVPELERGYYLFFKSKPVNNFEVLGHEKIGMVILSDDECVNRIFKRAGEYEGANAIIFEGLNYCSGTIIKLEN